MDFRRLVRGSVAWPRLEAVVRELLDRYDRAAGHVRFIEADNWLSTPFVLDGELFVKVVSRQNSVVHAVLTTGRNLGAVSSGEEGFFEHVSTPYEMAQREFEATERMRAVGVNAPEPVEVIEVDGLGVLVTEYLGDLRAENVLVVDGERYFVDATSLREPDPEFVSHTDAREAARQYDVACALSALEPLVGARTAVDAAASAYPPADLLGAREYLGFVAVRPDHDFDGPALRGEIDERVGAADDLSQ